MKVLIEKQNEGIIKEYLPKVKFTVNSTNTSVFIVSEKVFQQLYDNVKHAGYNPFALLYW